MYLMRRQPKFRGKPCRKNRSEREMRTILVLTWYPSLREALFTLILAKQIFGNPVLLLLPKSNHFLRWGSECLDRPSAPNRLGTLTEFDAWFWSCSQSDPSLNRLAIGASIIRSPPFEWLFWTFFENTEKNVTWEPSGRLGNLWRATTSHQILLICGNENWLL